MGSLFSKTERQRSTDEIGDTVSLNKHLPTLQNVMQDNAFTQFVCLKELDIGRIVE